MTGLKAALFLALAFAGDTLSGAAWGQSAPIWRNGTVSPKGDAGFMFMAAKGGFGAAFGLDLQMVALRGDPLLLKALIAGQLDSYVGGPGSPLVAASRGADLRIVGCGWVKQNYVLWSKPAIKTLADLAGHTIGVSSPGSAPDIFMRYALSEAGVAPSGVNAVSAGDAPDLLKAIATGVVDATAIPDEYAARAEAFGLHALTTSEAATPLSMRSCYIVAGSAVREHPDRVAEFLAAEMAAYTYSASHRELTIVLSHAVAHAPADAPEPASAFDNAISHGAIDPTFEPPIEKLRWLADVLTQSGQMKPGFDVASMVELGPLKRARQLVAEAGAAPAEQAGALLAAAVKTTH